MRYVMKQKLFSLKDRFTIKDERDNEAYAVEGKMLSIGNQLKMTDSSGNEAMVISQKILALRPTYRILHQGKIVAVVKKKLFSFGKSKFDVEMEGGTVVIEGDFWDQEYSLKRGDAVLGSVSKKWFSWSDTYGVEVPDEANAPLVLALSVVVDMVCHGDSGNTDTHFGDSGDD